ncbi:hypothetical protein EON65_32355, partial [archaeon]
MENGNILRPCHVRTAPEVSLRNYSSPDERFSLVLLDLDSIPTADTDRTYLHWCVLNFPGNNIKGGDEVTPYFSPMPYYDSGLHRFFFLLFKHTQPLTPVVLNEVVELCMRREGFNLTRWTKVLGFDPYTVVK